MRFGIWLAVSFAVLSLPIDSSVAQSTSPGLSRPEQFERSIQGQTGPTETSQDVTSPVDVVRPDERRDAAPTQAQTGAEVSRLEAYYTRRLRREVPGRDALGGEPPVLAAPHLKQFGYRMLGSLGVAGQALSTGAINEPYRLGIGDEVVVTLRGQINQSYRTRVDSEGRVVLPDIPPIPAAGLTFGEFRAKIEEMASATFTKTEAFVSLGMVRNFPVLVLGQVHRPGVHRLTGVASVLDAIVVAGGVQKTGSLRRIQIIRGTRTVPVDLYDLLLTGRLGKDLAIMEGDRVFVPPLGQTVAVAGDVLRPGIFEMGANTSGLTVSQAVNLAGGPLGPEGYGYLKISARKTGGDQVSEIADPANAQVENGDILVGTKAGYAWEGAFFLDGHVSVPGPRSLEGDRTVGTVVGAPDVLLEDPYLLFATLETTDPGTQARHFVPVDLGRITGGDLNVPLKPMDRLIILGADDIRFLSSLSVQTVIEGRSAGLDDCRGLQALAAVVSRSRSERFGSARLAVNPEKQAAVPTGETCPAVFDRYPNLLSFVLDFVVAIRGEVRRPGLYPVAPDTSLASLVSVVGGLASEADLSRIELTRFGPVARRNGSDSVRRTIDARSHSLLEVNISPGDIVRFNPRFTDRDTGSVLLTGEFKRPGVYAIRRGERLSEIIDRAGGLTEQAYPLGAVFSRVRVKEQEREAFNRAARDLESGLAESLAEGELQGPEAAGLVTAVRELAAALRTAEPVGRVVIEADPIELAVRPELDMLLEPGDRLHLPKRSNHVTVSGEVYSPGTIQFRAGKTADKYIDATGGITRAADDGRTFVIFPNGEAQRIAVSAWNFTSVHIPPGSTLVVPRDPKPFDVLAFSTSITDILSKLAITAASLIVIQQ